MSLFPPTSKKSTNTGEKVLPPKITIKRANAILNKNIDRVSLPENDDERNAFPLADGLLDYFPNALAEVARISQVAGDKHHPGERLHWERGKSTDHRNKILRHLIDSGKKDSKGNRHSGALAWRALALLQEELEQEFGYPLPRNAR